MTPWRLRPDISPEQFVEAILSVMSPSCSEWTIPIVAKLPAVQDLFESVPEPIDWSVTPSLPSPEAVWYYDAPSTQFYWREPNDGGIGKIPRRVDAALVRHLASLLARDERPPEKRQEWFLPDEKAYADSARMLERIAELEAEVLALRTDRDRIDHLSSIIDIEEWITLYRHFQADPELAVSWAAAFRRAIDQASEIPHDS